MAFRSIGDLAIKVLAEIETAHTDTGAATNAPRSVAPQVGGGNPLRMGETGKKNAEAEAPASADREENVKQGKKSAANLRVVSDNRRCLDTASRRRSKPHAPVVSRHLRLVVSNHHASAFSGAR